MKTAPCQGRLCVDPDPAMRGVPLAADPTCVAASVPQGEGLRPAAQPGQAAGAVAPAAAQSRSPACR